MQSIGICIVIEPNHTLKQTVNCIYNLIESCKGAIVSFYILNNANKDIELDKFLKSVSNAMCIETENPSTENYRHFTTKINYYLAINELVRTVKEDFIVVFKNGVYLNKNWYASLLNCYHNIKTSAIMSIYSGFEKTSIGLTLDYHQELTEVRFPEKGNTLEGIMMIRKEIIHTFGMFNHKLIDSGFERDELFYRLDSNGFVSYYAINENCIDIQLVTDIKTSKGLNDYKCVVIEMKQSGIFKTQL